MNKPVDEQTEKTGAIANFDHRDHESAHCPWPRWAQLRAESSIPWSESHDGFFVLSRYKDIFDAARDQATFSSNLKTVNIPPLPFTSPPINFDPPEHRGYREIVNPFFTPAKVAEYTPWIRETANRYTERLLQQESFDVITDLGVPVTNDVTLHVLGITDPPAGMKQWAESVSLQKDDNLSAGQQLIAYLSAEVDRRRTALGDDVISALINAKYDGRPLTQDEIVSMTLLLVLAGLDTTTSAIGGSVWHLVQNADARNTLASADEKTWRLALDEFVRWVSPVVALARTARHDVEFHGCPMKAGDRILMVWGSGNRDETEFPNPDQVILDRFPNRHMGFGLGPHRCLGSHLAKAIMQAVLQGLLQGLDNFRLQSADNIAWAAAEVRGIRSLPLVRK